VFGRPGYWTVATRVRLPRSGQGGAEPPVNHQPREPSAVFRRKDRGNLCLCIRLRLREFNTRRFPIHERCFDSRSKTPWVYELSSFSALRYALRSGTPAYRLIAHHRSVNAS
jgi:hypothetical protein